MKFRIVRDTDGDYYVEQRKRVFLWYCWIPDTIDHFDHLPLKERILKFYPKEEAEKRLECLKNYKKDKPKKEVLKYG